MISVRVRQLTVQHGTVCVTLATSEALGRAGCGWAQPVEPVWGKRDDSGRDDTQWRTGAPAPPRDAPRQGRGPRPQRGGTNRVATCCLPGPSFLGSGALSLVHLALLFLAQFQVTLGSVCFVTAALGTVR